MSWQNPKPDAETALYAAGKYAEAARFVDVAMAISGKRCAGGECDLGSPCRRHRNAAGVAFRYLRMKGER